MHMFFYPFTRLFILGSSFFGIWLERDYRHSTESTKIHQQCFCQQTKTRQIEMEKQNMRGVCKALRYFEYLTSFFSRLDSCMRFLVFLLDISSQGDRVWWHRSRWPRHQLCNLRTRWGGENSGSAVHKMLESVMFTSIIDTHIHITV